MQDRRPAVNSGAAFVMLTGSIKLWRCGRFDDGIIAQGRDYFQAHVAVAPDRSLIILF